MNTPVTIRPAAVAGMFYPDDAVELQSMIGHFMRNLTPASPSPKALVAPHAGYVYSGLTAAHAYINLIPLKDRIKRIVLLGPAHRVYVKGLALSSATHFATPLGNIPIDQTAVELLKNYSQVVVSDAAHAQEHSLEVHLPFLQTVLDQFTLVPLVVGEASPDEVAEVLELFWDQPDTFIIISSDLSHYHDYDSARKIDSATTRAIENLQLEQIGPQRACGCRPLNGLLQLARHKGLLAQTLDVRNSGDTAGTRDRVVGYGAWSFSAGTAISDSDTRILLDTARESIKQGLTNGKALEINTSDFPETLQGMSACFVTIEMKGRLRGCIGNTQAVSPLINAVSEHAWSAAFQDPRFDPLSENEFDNIHISISILTPSTPLIYNNEQELLARLRQNIDGLIIQKGNRRATFLPSVWESLHDKKTFLYHLKKKAGIAPDQCPDKAWVYQAIYLEE